MSVFLILPGFASLKRKFTLEIRKAFDGFPLFPREFEIDVLKFIVKTDLTGVRESRPEIYPINACPIDGAHERQIARTR